MFTISRLRWSAQPRRPPCSSPLQVRLARDCVRVLVVHVGQICTVCAGDELGENDFFIIKSGEEERSPSIHDNYFAVFIGSSAKELTCDCGTERDPLLSSEEICLLMVASAERT